jgi:hypothetical protein
MSDRPPGYCRRSAARRPSPVLVSARAEIRAGRSGIRPRRRAGTNPFLNAPICADPSRIALSHVGFRARRSPIPRSGDPSPSERRRARFDGRRAGDVVDGVPDTEYGRKRDRLAFAQSGDWHHWLCATASTRRSSSSFAKERCWPTPRASWRAKADGRRPVRPGRLVRPATASAGSQARTRASTGNGSPRMGQNWDKFASRRTSKNNKSPAVQGFSDAGGGTRTPDARIMIGALPLVFA